MILYDMQSEVDWFYTGPQTFEDMKSDPERAELTRVPCVLYDNGAGKVYGYDTLEALASKWAVPYSGDAQGTFSTILARMDGTYRAEGVAEVEEIATEAKATADTAAASVDEYMDALLGLNATDETGATDAE